MAFSETIFRQPSTCSTVIKRFIGAASEANSSTFPTSDLYDLEELLTQLGTGEAAVTILSESGVPTPVVHTKLRAPLASMKPAADVDGAAKASPLYAKYGTKVDRDSARERLAARIEQQPAPPAEAAPKRRPPPPIDRTGDPITDPLGDFLGSRQGKALQREVVRGMFGLLRKRL